MLEMIESLSSFLSVSRKSLFLVFVLDAIWTFPELASTITGILLVILCAVLGAVTFVIVLLIERFDAEKSWGKAFSSAILMGAVAAVPYCVGSLLYATGRGGLWLVQMVLPKPKSTEPPTDPSPAPQSN